MTDIIHNFNTILGGLLLHANYLEKAAPKDEALRESISEIVQGINQGEAMCNSILCFAKGQEEPVTCIEMGEVVESCLKMLKFIFSPIINIKFYNYEKDVFVLGSRSDLSQIIINLVTNAREALPDGGEIEIRFNLFKCQSIMPRKYLSLTIKDNGMGIPQHMQEKIFEPLFSTKEEKGTGLGLSSVKTLVEKNGGKIKVKSCEGKGSTFEVLFPVVERPESTSNLNASSRDHNLKGNGERILIVEDNDSVRRVTEKNLQFMGFEVESTGSSIKAFEMIKNARPSYDLVLLDMIMPEMGGDTLFFKLKEKGIDVPVIVCSGWVKESRVQAVLENGGIGFLKKPFSSEKLGNKIRNSLDMIRDKNKGPVKK